MAKSAFILIIGVAYTLAASLNFEESRIVGGNIAHDGQFPYQVSLKIQGNHLCGGSIIDATTILSTAFCVHGYTETDITILIGTNELTKGGTIHKVKSYIIHPQYDAFFDNDIAIIKLTEPIQFNKKVATIELEEGTIGADEDCITSGWGYTSFPSNMQNDLLYIELKTYATESCKKALLPVVPVYDTNICTLTRNGKGVCFGDSGSPLVSITTGKQIGIISRGYICATGLPDVSTKVQPYLDWIKANM